MFFNRFNSKAVFYFLLVFICLNILGCARKKNRPILGAASAEQKEAIGRKGAVKPEKKVSGADALKQTKDVKGKKPKILVLSSRGGNGHMSVCATLQEVLPEYDIVLKFPIHDFFGDLEGENWYVRSLQKGRLEWVNFVSRLSVPVFKFGCKGMKRQIRRYVEEEKPDLLISVIPFVNYPASWVANKYNIPFRLITLDADLTFWLVEMERAKHNFIMTVVNKTPRIDKQLAHAHIPSSCVQEIGYQLRNDFLTPKNHKAIRKGWNIPDGKEVVLIMRGGTGSDKMLDYVKALIKSDRSLHLLVCVGKNTTLIPKLNAIKNSGKVTFSVIPFTQKIPDLMAVSDLLIAQPSPTVCNEASAMNLPILVDMTTKCLFWEVATIDWMNGRNEYAVLKHMKDLNKAVASCLDHKKPRLAHATKPKHDFKAEVRKLVIDALALPSLP